MSRDFKIIMTWIVVISIIGFVGLQITDAFWNLMDLVDSYQNPQS